MLASARERTEVHLFPGGLKGRSSTQNPGFVSRIAQFNKTGFFNLKGKAEREKISNNIICSLSLMTHTVIIYLLVIYCSVKDISI